MGNGNRMFSEHEYDSLRNEMIARIESINNQANSAIITILSTWTIGFSLIVVADKFKTRNYILLLITALIFLVPIYYFVPLAIKSGENIQQIASISAYIRVFFEYCSEKNGREVFNWETSNNMCSAVNVDRGKKSIIMRLYNEEYTILSVASFIFYCLISESVQSSDIIKDTAFSYWLCKIIIWSFGLLSLGAIYAIHHVSCMHNAMMKHTAFYVEKYIDRACELGTITIDEKEKAQDALNPFRGEVMKSEGITNRIKLKLISMREKQ